MILAKIQSKKDFMSKVEKKIAEIILKEPEKFINYSAAELSEIAGVSQGSINNFSKKFADGGFPELKVKIATELNDYKGNFFSKVSGEDSISDVMKISAQNIFTAFCQTQQINSEETLQRVVNMIVRAKKIEVYGIAQSAVVAKDCAYQLIKLGFTAKSVTEVLMCPVSAMTLDSDSLVIAISAAGKTKDVYDAVKIAKENGAAAVCITRNENSSVAKMCDEILLVGGGDEELSRFLGTVRICDYFLVDAVCSYIRHRMNEDDKKRYSRVLDILNSHMMED